MNKRMILGPGGVQIELDKDQVFPDDPGNGTPAIVRYCGHTATYWCAWDTMEVDGVDLPPRVWEWLDSKDTEINEFLYGTP